AAGRGLSVVNVEQTAQPARKLLITGGGHCNITNNLPAGDFLDACRPYDRFLRHAIFSFPPEQTCLFFERIGLPLYFEDSGKVFPASQDARDVLKVLLAAHKASGARLFTSSKVSAVRKENGGFTVECGDLSLRSKKMIVASGGISYPKTGSDGSMFAICRKLGHKVTPLKASLVAVKTKEDFSSIAGISVEEAQVGFFSGKKRLAFNGPLVFTDTGIGGPAVLNMSREVIARLESGAVEAYFDLLPALAEQDAEKYIDSLLAKSPRKQVPQILTEFIPRSLAMFICEKASLTAKTAANVARKERKHLLELVKRHPVTITALRDVNQAAVTRGGIDNSEIDSKTMESKIVPGLFFAGEVIDVDGPCGGFNLQIAFATGLLAGRSV
ncbi:MAG: NAD(P)/FAD-dependent oxidoreductase, partial [Phycisphaerae bacterium]